MQMKIERKALMILTVTIVAAFFLGNFSFAADSTGEDAEYNKFFSAIGIEAQYNQMINLMISQYQQSYSTGIQTSIKKMSDISEKDKTEIQKVANESLNSFLQKMKVKMNEVMPFQELVKNVYMPTYKKHFTLDEIKEVTKFYEGAVGKKFISMSSTMMQEAAAIYNQNYNQKIMQISNELAESEFTRVKQAIEAVKNNKSTEQAAPAK